MRNAAYETKLFEEAGFTPKQVDALVAFANQLTAHSLEHDALDSAISAKLTASEAKQAIALKDFEISIIKELQHLGESINKLGADVTQEIEGIKSDVKLIKGLGGFFVTAVIIVGIIVGSMAYFKASEKINYLPNATSASFNNAVSD